MKKSFKSAGGSLLLLLTLLVFDGCRREVVVVLPKLVGNPGNPRFNLQFTNEQNVDLDLYVLDPNKETIFYGDPRAVLSTGQLDVDCLCGDCIQGPNENIFWSLNSESPRGKYEFWVDYFDFCTTEQPSTFKVTVTNDKLSKPVIFTATGTLTRYKENSTHWIYDSATGKVTIK